MRVAVRLTHPQGSGGIEQYVAGLAAGLSALEGSDSYHFVGAPALRDELLPFIAPPSYFIVQAAAERSRTLMRISRSRPGRVAVRVRHRLLRDTPYTVRRAPDVIESGGYDVVHFPTQVGEITDRPCIYQPWDLQHLHFPQFFTGEQLRVRDALWRGCTERATYVLVASQFVRDDVIDRFGIDSGRIAVISPGAPTSLHRSSQPAGPVGETPFALYPAQAWLHKNHIRLLDAIALLRGQGIDISLVCPGQPNARFRELRRHAAELGLDGVVQFPGYVSDDDLALLYRRARCLVFPSLFEGFGFPVLEAFDAGLPVACSSTSSLGELAGDAAVQFDPMDVESIAQALVEVWTDDALRTTLIARGHERAQAFSWDRFARSCRALYRAAAQAPLEADDRALLAGAGVTV